MTDILIYQSNSRVVVVDSSLVLVGDRYVGATSTYPLNAFIEPVTLVQSVSNVPDDLVPGYNYNYVEAAFVSSGVAPPGPAPTDLWTRKIPIATNRFVALATGVITPAGWQRLKTDAASSWVYDMVMTSQLIDPNDKDHAFRQAMTYLNTTNGADGKLLLTTDQLTQINASWPEVS